jgi:hypothetical protein
LEDLLFTVVTLHWVEVWETTVALDRLSQLKLPKSFQVVGHLVQAMKHLVVEANTKAKPNSTTTPTKATNLVQATTWSHSATQRTPMDLAHHFLRLVDQDPQPTRVQDQPFLHPNLSKVDTATQLTSNSNFMAARPAHTLVSVELEVTKQLAKATRAANTEATKLSEATTTVTTRNADGAATTEDIK